ncbi:breast cancer type 1 susceptibility protein isoform X3 [Centrocercus urophasianus]|uniref:breast cancer type 1 susceptibility protein isoform X3 n=1 Tax=Centrocercus urophasianus TaxID=9002 RepID=UPI001C64D772|nr:breast cancer type 1 susceptibility protein isoform X3 [Centrocercus urophasianus]
MDLSVIAIGDVQNVLSAMQKNLECPVCLDVIKEPVSTKCDHIFCRFCMFKLLSKKKKGVIQCPLCKTEVTKRSLKENSRFKQLIEGLLEAISAFELDTGVKFLSSYFPKTSTEAASAELLGNNCSVIQSKGFRNRKISAKENGQDSYTLEANVDPQLTDNRVEERYLTRKKQKHGIGRSVLIELGTDSSEEIFMLASDTGRLKDKEELEEFKSAEKYGSSCNTQSLKLGAEEITLPDVIGETDFLKEALSKKSMLNITEHVKSNHVNTIEGQSSSNVFDADLLTEQCDGIGNASPLKNNYTFFSNNAEEMDAEESLCSSKNQELDFEDGSESTLDKIKEKDICVPSVEDVEMYEPMNDSLLEKELPVEKLLQPKIPHCPTLHEVSRKRLKQSIQKVNEWFSKSNETLSSSSFQNDSSEATDASGEGDISLSDKDSCISEKTNPIVDSVEFVVFERNKRWPKQTTYSIKDKIFGKTYERGRKSNPSTILRDVLPAAKKEDTAAEEECLNNSREDRLKRKREPARVLQPEDFIEKKDLEEADRCPQGINSSLEGAEKRKCDGNSAVKENPLLEKIKVRMLTEFEEGGLQWKNAIEKVSGMPFDGQLEFSNSDQKSTKNACSAAKGCRRSTRTRCAIRLVVDRNPDSFGPDEPLIDSYPSSEEPNKVDCEQRQVRRSRRLQLLSKETGKMRITKEARNSNSGPEGSVFGVERNVLVHSSQCKDLRKQQDILNCTSLTDRNGADLVANGIQISPKNSADITKNRSLFNPTFSCQHSNFNSPSLKAGSQEGEMLGRLFLLQSPSKTVLDTASILTEEKRSGSWTVFPQDKRCCSQNVPEDFRIEKSPMAKNVSELTVEAEDSELDMQHLRNTFRSSKRQSFSLYPAPMKTCTTDDVESKKLNTLCPDQVEKRCSKYFMTENLQEKKTTAENLSSVCEKFKTCESACVSPVSCSVSNAECVHAVEHQEDILNVANHGNLTTLVRMCAARNEGRNRPQEGEQESEKTLSADIGVESKLRLSPVGSNRNLSDRSDAEEHAFQRTDLNTVSETYFSSESNQVENAEVVDGKAPMQRFQPSPMVCPTACQQNPAEFNCRVTEKKVSRKEGSLVKGNEERVIQTVSTGLSEYLVKEALEESLKVRSDFTDLSETPDGLLCSDNDTEDSASFYVTNRKDTSAVFVKRSGAALVNIVNDSVVSCKPRSEGIQRSRRRAQKLQSSDEESSEDEDLPCFQELMFGKSVSTPLQIKKQVTSVVQSSANPSMLPHSERLNENNEQKTLEAALSNECVSPSQESECSVKLFSSQSNISEESVDGAQELRKTLTQVSDINKSKEALQSCSGGLKRRKNDSNDEYQEDPNMGANLGEASGYDSETSRVEDSHEPFSQGEILSTQQKNAMQNNLKKLQEEMAVLEAVLKQHASQDTEVLPLCRELPCSSSGGTLGMEQMRQETENASEHDSETKLSKAPVLPVLCRNVTSNPNSSSSSVKHPCPQNAQTTNNSAVAQCDNKSSVRVHESKRNVCFPTSVLHNAAGKENAASSGTTYRTEMSIVASGLNQSEHLMVQKFARKTQSTFSNHITDGTTHVIMKTDEELVCERTLKYFLGIAGRKWVVSYQWIIQSFKEGRILDEENFEVKGDVINGRNHQGPKRARQSLAEKIFKDFEICCYGPFTDMTAGHLEWIVELCGASVVKQLHLFTHKVNSTAVVVVQPDAWMEGTSYEAIQQKNNVAVVTREWVLDSVACFECQELDAYLVS